MKKLALILALILASGSAWAVAPILETDGPANFDITSEIAIGSYTASANTEVIAQVRLVSGLTATAANISLRLAQTSAGDVELAGYVDGVARSKNAAANTYYGCRNLGGNGFTLLTGQKAVVYVLSSNANDTAVSCQVDWIDALALPTGAATSASIAALNDAPDLTTEIADLPTNAELATALTDMATGADVTAAQGVITSAITAAQGVITSAITSATSTTDGYITAAQGVITGAITSATSTIDGYITAATSTITDAIAAIPAAVWNFLMNAATTVGGFGKFFNDYFN